MQTSVMPSILVITVLGKRVSAGAIHALVALARVTTRPIKKTDEGTCLFHVIGLRRLVLMQSPQGTQRGECPSEGSKWLSSNDLLEIHWSNVRINN